MKNQRTAPEPPRIEGARWIALSRQDFALVDEGAFERVSRWCWSTLIRPGRTSYAFRRSHGTTIYLHRFIVDAPAGMDVDHIDGNTLDCRASNLRICTHAENQRNYSKTKRPTSSRFKGVQFDKARKKWMAHIKLNRKARFLGRFDTEEAAALAYDAKAVELFGRFAKLNLPGRPAVMP